MPVETKPEDKPSAVKFQQLGKAGELEVRCALLPNQKAPYQIDGGSPRFGSVTAFKARAVEVGLTPAVAEDWTRSFNATARQLRKLGFQVSVKQDEA